ncbi:hypothetical protein CQW23_06621 [Capsicum baccatum]|uniref:F-box/kelch-repeat protein n=1 Tax=Capsicum baccatum TaxID=33114 RepID=A0A2G2X403_CAPBA|nr:hypothetical protein CQW23_06621 [Capsicum baccatum]
MFGLDCCCIGGIKRSEEHFGCTIGHTLYKYNTTEKCNKWKCMEPHRNLGMDTPYVFAFDKKIYVIGGKGRLIQDINLTYAGEYYDLDFKTWQYMPKLDLDDGDTFTFLFYNLVEDAWIHDDRLKNVKLFWEDGLEKMGCIHMLRQVVSHARPVVCDSTLYWFNNDMCLYGYDYSRKRWFQSNSLGHKLQWQTSQNCNQMFPTQLLFYRDNQTFVAIFPNPSNKILSLAIIRVKRNRHSGSIKVSLKSSQYIAAETEQHMILSIVDGMTVDTSAEEKEVEKKGQWRLPTFFTAIGVLGAEAFVAVCFFIFQEVTLKCLS